MLESVKFTNFRVLRSATLPLGRCTIIVGPNGSGKSTALLGLRAASVSEPLAHSQVASRNHQSTSTNVQITFHFKSEAGQTEILLKWSPNKRLLTELLKDGQVHPLDAGMGEMNVLKRTQIFAFDARAISEPVQLQPGLQLAPDGRNLAGVIDQIRDIDPDRFDALNAELHTWMPEFRRILFETPTAGRKQVLLGASSGEQIPARDLSDGSLFALALLTLSYLPDPPSIVCLEEPDRGVHPRLMHEVQQAIYRLAYPENFGDKRAPVQVIATTHSPYLLDLFKEHPEEIMIAEKQESGATFHRLSDSPHIKDILAGAPLGEVWYSGVLGGVPAGT